MINFTLTLFTLDPFYSVILMCRSGKRSTEVFENPFIVLFFQDNFDNVYEIDSPEGKNGRGGFQGSNYDSYNGYRGFPSRDTSMQEYKAVSWMDSGLPVHIGGCPSAD